MRIDFDYKPEEITITFKNHEGVSLKFTEFDADVKNFYNVICTILHEVMLMKYLKIGRLEAEFSQSKSPNDIITRWPTEDIRICIDAIWTIAKRIAHYEICLKCEKILNHIECRQELLFKQERFKDLFYNNVCNHQTLVEIISIVFVAINQLADSTLSNAYPWYLFTIALETFFKPGNRIALRGKYKKENMDRIDSFINLPTQTLIAKDYYHRKSLVKDNFNYVFKFMSRIDYKIEDYILQFYPYTMLHNGFTDTPHCFLLCDRVCMDCKRRYYKGKTNECIRKEIGDIAIIE